ncbi:DUF1080 domain-containing protein [Mucilaginibacter sp. dw_454]|uniref:3-keto-disaccharide hydrolase n=1 Tax=Mucilaginibacter sp. dw_454 TaxID=2720079 RepID=UPI001BD62073|nr:DUF1080 domain-containing protein [Mucilaginibacter sp. dw_454]
MRYNLFLATALLGVSTIAYGQTTSADIKKANLPAANPTDAEMFSPVPNVVTPAKTFGEAPSDAIILFDGKNLDQWENAKDQSVAKWKVADGLLTVDKSVGDIETKQKFTSFQLHIEWKIPADITGKGQERGNSGIFLSGKYEIQVLDTYNNDNKTYTNGMAGAVYRESIPLVNPAHKAGEWNIYDIAYQAPEFNADGTVKTPAHVTILFNGVLVQNNTEIRGGTSMTNVAHAYKAHDAMPLRLQAHGDKSEPISYRNIWIRE